MRARILDRFLLDFALPLAIVSLGVSVLLNPAAASSAPITSIACPAPIAVDAFCGAIRAPLDRSHPERGTLMVGFALYAPSGNSIGTIVARQGGPGPASTAPQFIKRVRGVMGPLAASGFSLLFVDQRGRGLSSVIDCTPLQHSGVTPASVAACASSLIDSSGLPGSAAGNYSTAASADDLEDVRAALVAAGLIPNAPINLFGQSYGGVDLEAYAARYPQNVRSMVGDSPATSTADFFNVRYSNTITSTIRIACRLNPGCRADSDDIAALVSALRAHPDSGTGMDYTGTPQTVAATESTLLNSVLSNEPNPEVAQLGAEVLNQGEAGAAARAYLRGDKAPLFRLLAENLAVLAPLDFGVATRYSGGANIATICADTGNAPWTWGSPGAQADYLNALSRLNLEDIAPYSRGAWNVFLENAFIGDTCTPWPASPTPVIPRRALRTAAPVLALSGNMDLGVPTRYAQQWAARYPNSTLVRLNGRAHIPAVRGDVCTQMLIRAFIANPSAPLDTECAAQPEILPLATADFPLYSAQAIPAAPDPSVSMKQAGGPAERRLATAAVATVLDGFKRFSMAADLFAEPALAGVGLRGGSVVGVLNADADGTFTLTFSAARFVQDVSVDAAVTWDPVTFEMSGTVALAGASGGTIGTLSISGSWRLPGQAPLQVRGVLNGRQVALLVPSI